MLNKNVFTETPQNKSWLEGFTRGAIAAREEFARSSDNDAEQRAHMAIANSYKQSGINHYCK